MDLPLPILDGYEAHERIKHNSYLRHIPIVVRHLVPLVERRMNTRRALQALRLTAKPYRRPENYSRRFNRYPDIAASVVVDVEQKS